MSVSVWGGVLALCVLALVSGVAIASGVGLAPGASESLSSDGEIVTTGVADGNVTESAYVERAPERGDHWYEGEDDDGEWISYVNPRDEYRTPYLGPGSGKICVAVFNEAGEAIVGTTLENTTVTIPTGESLAWHSAADPMAVEFPLVEHYERPLDADQFGTTESLPQGDGYMDSHCIEFHGMPEDGAISYGEAELSGDRADWLEVVGYIQQDRQSWDSDVDPIADAVAYNETGGGWTFEPGGSHGQVVAVLQLDPPADASPVDSDSSGDEETSGTDDPDSSDEESDSDGSDGHDREGSSGSSDRDGGESDDEAGDTQTSGTDGTTSDGDEDGPGFGVAIAILGGVLLGAFLWWYPTREPGSGGRN